MKLQQAKFFQKTHVHVFNSFQDGNMVVCEHKTRIFEGSKIGLLEIILCLKIIFMINFDALEHKSGYILRLVVYLAHALEFAPEIADKLGKQEAYLRWVHKSDIRFELGGQKWVKTTNIYVPYTGLSFLIA